MADGFTGALSVLSSRFKLNVPIQSPSHPTDGPQLQRANSQTLPFSCSHASCPGWCSCCRRWARWHYCRKYRGTTTCWAVSDIVESNVLTTEVPTRRPVNSKISCRVCILRRALVHYIVSSIGFQFRMTGILCRDISVASHPMNQICRCTLTPVGTSFK
jgi:hypothetical protein